MTLENLVRIHELNKEAPNKREFEGLVNAATDRLNDSENGNLSYASRYDLAYNAAHGLALAALRQQGTAPINAISYFNVLFIQQI